MRVTVDRFGRIHIPKAVRRAVGMEAGTDLRLEIQEDQGGERSVVISPETDRPLLVKEGNLLVYKGKLDEREFDLVEFIRRQREDRSRKLSGR